MERKLYLQYFSVISSFAVVILHLNGCFWDFSYERYWVTANFIESVMYFAVPVFFMMSGITLIDYRKKYSTKLFFRKRIVKTVIPFLVWSLIGLLFLTVFKEKNIFEMTINEIISSILDIKIIEVFWFFIPLFATYLCIPVLGAVTENSKKQIYSYIIVCAFIVNSLLPLLGQLIGITFRLRFPIGADYIIYLLIGYLIDQNEIDKKTRKSIYVFGILGFTLHFLGTWYLSYQAGSIVSDFKGYTNVPCILYATAVFVFGKYFFRNKKVDRIFLKLTTPFIKQTFGIYLIHWFVKYIWTYSNIFSVTSISYRILGSIFVFFVSAGLVHIMQKIPVIKRTVP